MNKLAAGQIAQEYYKLGQDMALEKLASPMFLNNPKATKAVMDAVSKMRGGAKGLAHNISGQLATAGKTQSRVPFTGGRKAYNMLQGAGLRSLERNPQYALNVNRLGVGVGRNPEFRPGLNRITANAMKRDRLGNTLAPTINDIVTKPEVAQAVMTGGGATTRTLPYELANMPSEAQLRRLLGMG